MRGLCLRAYVTPPRVALHRLLPALLYMTAGLATNQAMHAALASSALTSPASSKSVQVASGLGLLRVAAPSCLHASPSDRPQH